MTHGFEHPSVFLFVNSIHFYVTRLRYAKNRVESDIITFSSASYDNSINTSLRIAEMATISLNYF